MNSQIYFLEKTGAKTLPRTSLTSLLGEPQRCQTASLFQPLQHEKKQTN